MHFLDDAVLSDPNSDDGYGDDDENEYQRSLASIENVPLPYDDPDLFSCLLDFFQFFRQMI